MIELIAIAILGVTDLALMAGFYLFSKEFSKERHKLLNAVIAKNARELQELEITQNIEPAKEVKPPDLIPIESLTDEEWAEKVLGETSG